MTTETTTPATDSYVALHGCGGMLAAVVIDEAYPARFARAVAKWSRWKTPPEIIRQPIEATRQMPFCKCSAKERRN